MGRDKRRAFDELVIDINPDAGPEWLDRMIQEKTRFKTAVKKWDTSKPNEAPKLMFKAQDLKKRHMAIEVLRELSA
jgi:hypothetical protein